jgi:hypothetical protein
MTEAQHTQGPWEEGTITNGQGKEVVGEAFVTMGDPEDPECEARILGRRAKENARLIAAAPALLSAAITVLNGLHKRIDDAAPNELPIFDGIAALFTAIRKAGGESRLSR